MILKHLMEDPELGYCQGMTLVAAVFAAAAEDPEAYTRFAAFVRQVRGLWLPGFPLLAPCMAGFEVLAREKPWFEHFARLGVRSDMFLPQALLSMFVNWLPLMMLLHCLSFLEDFGLAALLSLAIAFLDLHEARLLTQPTFEELMEVLQSLKQAECSESKLLEIAESGMAQASEVLETEQIEPRPHGRLKRKGSQVVDEDGKEILATGLGSVDWISSSETGTSHWMSDWWQAAGLHSSLFSWAFLQCEVPATEWGMFWNSPELVLPEVRERRRYPGMVGAGHFEVYCPDPVDLLSGWSFLLSTGNTRQRLRTMSLLKGNQRLTQCTKEGTAGFVHPRDVHPSRCCRCGERASLVHIPGDMKQWSFVDTLFRYHSPFSDWEEKELQETLTRQLWQKESRFAEQSRHVQGAAGQMVELYGGEVCFRRDFSMCCSARNELRGGQKVLYKTLNMKPLPPPFHLEVETTAKSDAHLLMGQGPLNSLEIVAGAHGGAWSAARWVSEGSFVALTAFDGSPQQDSRDRSGAAKYSVQLEEDGRLLVRHGLSEWGFYLPEKYLNELRQHPVGIYVGVPGDLSATWNLCRKSLAEKASACFDASRALTKSLMLSLQGNCLPEFVLVVVCSKSMGILRASVAVCVGLVRCLLLFAGYREAEHRPHTKLNSNSSYLQAVMADLNTLCYGNEAGITDTAEKQKASAEDKSHPGQVRSLVRHPAIIVLPPLCCWLCVKGLKGSGGSRWTGCGAALAAGMLIGVLAGPLPGPYAFFQDVDVRDEMTHSSVQRAISGRTDL
ncbi:GYP5 [Symbiodinium necroappetens]|uniref:GYP5 protein n=1 Tax=Symbiodinium necroappetens TaxID=1628268 RepID=A0A813BSD2_9DINO|nr:GYP5 [Symbiodinium necroappetens]